MVVEIAYTLRSRLRGLHGKHGFEGALLLVPCHDVHTFGMRHPIDVAFVAADGTIVEAHRNVGPRRRLRNRAAAATLERYSDPSPWFDPGDRIQGKPCVLAVDN